MDSQSSFALSQQSVGSSIAAECTLNLDQDGLAELEQIESEYFLHWYDQIEEEAEDSEEEAKPGSDLDQEDTDLVTPVLSTDDLNVQQTEESFVTDGCGCKQACHLKFDSQEILGVRHTFLKLPQLERNQLILFAIQSFCQTPQTSTETAATKGHAVRVRQRAHSSFFFHGVPVCQTFFLFVYGITKKIYSSLLLHYKKSPIEYRLVKPHGNAKKLPHNTLPVTAKQEALTFIEWYATKHAMRLPFMATANNDAWKLPSDITKVGVHKEYVKGCRESGQQPVCLTVFKELWPSNFHVIKPTCDLCSTCERNNCLINLTANQSDEHKSQRVLKQQQHLNDASRERGVYKAQCEVSKDAVKKMVAEGVQPGQADINSNDISIHYSVDCPRDVLLPSFAQQPSQLYFKTGREVRLFVACNEGRPHGFMYAIDEAMQTGDGADDDISMLHDYIATQHYGEKTMHCHADNWGEQTNNNAFIHYFVWRCMVGLNTTITYAFMVGHTRLGPEWLAGMFKSSFRRADVQCLEDVAEVIRKCSATAKVLQPRVVGSADSPLHTYTWQDHLEQFFKPLPAIRKYNYFRFEASEPGVVYMKTGSSDPEERVNLLKTTPQHVIQTMLPVKPPLGLSLDRQKYLYKEIRPFLDEAKKDLTAPRPDDLDTEDNEQHANKRRRL